jgi:Na+/proline symporter
MFSPISVILAVVVYFGLLFLVAQRAERRSARGDSSATSAFVFALALQVQTYYGSVGRASTDGMLFLGVYVGPILPLLFTMPIMRRMVRLQELRHFTSIADFLSARYGKSQALAALATFILIVGMAPCLAAASRRATR